MTIFWSGLANGAIYALVAIGYNITIVGAGVVNFAFAHIIMICSFVALLGFTQGWPVVVIFAVTAVVGAAVGAIEERIAIRPLKAGGQNDLITTVGFGSILTGAAVILFGADPLAVNFLQGSSFRVFDAPVQTLDVVLVVIAVVIGFGLQFWMRRSRLGLASLARSEDGESAMLRGINVRAFSIGAFIVAGLLAGLIAPVVGGKTYASAFIPLALAIKGFTAMTIGGVGNNVAVLVGGLAIGLIEACTQYFIGGIWGNISVFVVFVGVLLLRPQGLLGEKELRTV